MSIREFQPSRAVEVIVIRDTRDNSKDSCGSGYRIGGRLVLTAAHLLDNVGSYCQVRDKRRSFGKQKAQVVWKAKCLDLALIELPEGVEGVEAITLGKLPEGKTGEKIAFQMYGYPGWGWTQRGQGSAASGLQVEGTIYLADTSPDSLLVLRIYENLASEYSEARVIQAIKANSQEPKSEWRGMSGAAVICDGLVVAVQTRHPRPMQPNHVEATPVGTVYADEQWRQLLKEYGINPEPEIVHLVSLEGQAETDFQPYLQAILANEDYREWQVLYTPITVEDRRQMPAHDIASISQRRFPSRLKLRAEMVKPDKREQGDRPDGVPKLQERVEQWDVLAGLRNYAAEHVVLIGKPGSGKSTSLERLLWEEAEKALHDSDARIPVLVKLRRCTGTIEGLIQDFLVGHQVTLEIAQIEELLRQGRFLVLLDGLNELPKTFETEVANFRDRYRLTTPMIVSTRDLGGGGTLGIEKTLNMLPLKEPQIREFVQGYLGEEGDRLFQQLQGDRLRKFAETPLLLWMLCRVFAHNGKVPDNLGLAFREFARLYDQNIQSDTPVDSRDQWHKLLRHLAFVMMQGKSSIDLQLSIPREEAEDCLTTYLQQTDRSNSRECAEHWLKDLLKYHLIQPVIQPNFEEHLEFCHQLIQEYYAAEYILKILPNLTDEQLKQDYLNYLKWQESISLMLGLIDEAQALRFVKLGLEVSPILGSILAGKVLNRFQTQAVEILLDLGLPDHVLANLLGETHSNAAIPVLEKFLKGGSWQTRDRLTVKTAISALKLIGTEATIPVLEEALQCYGDEDIVEALASIGSKSAFEKLLHLEKHPDKDIRSCVAHELGQFKSEQAINVLNNLLKDEESFVNARAVDTLKKIGTDSALALLVQAVQDRSNPSRMFAIHALGEVASEVYVPILIRELQDQDIYARWAIIKALENIGSEEAIATLHQIASKDPDLSCRESASNALQRLGNNVPPPEIAIDDSTFEGLFPPDRSDTCCSTIEKDWGILIDKAEPILIHILREGITALENSGYYRSSGSIDDLHTDFINSFNSDSEARRIAAMALERIGSPENLSQLWQLQKGNNNLNLLSTIAAINDRCGYFNHEIFAIQREKLRQQSEEERVMADPTNEGIHITHHYEVNAEVFQVVENNAGKVIGKEPLNLNEKGD
ncbi:HEAT repeat domain-containing protein [Leptothermofonsia sp. ETS-13]|uniref:HEAT repeat domain-containing protein n=1 Tax=Leptothermofonsia sp. ETS-13 TaxID=3035696 RepID=UPI003BA2D52F